MQLGASAFWESFLVSLHTRGDFQLEVPTIAVYREPCQPYEAHQTLHGFM